MLEFVSVQFFFLSSLTARIESFPFCSLSLPLFQCLHLLHQKTHNSISSLFLPHSLPLSLLPSFPSPPLPLSPSLPFPLPFSLPSSLSLSPSPSLPPQPTILASLCASVTLSARAMASSSTTGKRGSCFPISCSILWYSSTSYLYRGHMTPSV